MVSKKVKNVNAEEKKRIRAERRAQKAMVAYDSYLDLLEEIKEDHKKAMEDLARQSKYCINKSAVYVSDNMSGKLSGIPAISTNCTINSRCMANAEKQKDGFTNICKECFAQSTIDQYDSLSINLTKNYALLTSDILDLSDLPIFGNVRYVRLEAFGDLDNVIQAINYLHIAQINPEVNFALWTKNPDILDKAVGEVGKPENITLIVSSQFINCVESADYDWIDHIFTVWSDRETAEANGHCVNCRAIVNGKEQNSCMMCKKCYSKKNTTFYINELLK